MIEWIIVILAVCAAAGYVCYKTWQWSCAKSCGGCGDSPGKSSRKQQITVGGKTVRSK